MSNEKCFCHVTDKITGEQYVVKDKEAREWLEALTDNGVSLRAVPAIGAGAGFGSGAPASNIMLVALESTASSRAIVQRDANGRAQIADPVSDGDIANKKYVDSLAGARYFHEITLKTSSAYMAANQVEIKIVIKVLSNKKDAFTIDDVFNPSITIVSDWGFIHWLSGTFATIHNVRIDSENLYCTRVINTSVNEHDISKSAVNNGYIITDVVKVV